MTLSTVRGDQEGATPPCISPYCKNSWYAALAPKVPALVMSLASSIPRHRGHLKRRRFLYEVLYTF